MVLLNRLIYYYNIYMKINDGVLQGFSNTAVVIISLHGSYRTYDDIKYLSPDKDVFLYSKSSPGSLALNYCFGTTKQTMILSNTVFNIWTKMKRQPYVPFDELNLSSNIDMIGVESYSQANPRIENQQFAKAMQHYISPQTQKYIDKIYERDDEYKYVIDVEDFMQIPGSMVDKLARSNVFGRLRANPLDPNQVTLSSIIDYYLYRKKKRNLFIYDMSCGSMFHESDEILDKLYPTHWGLNITEDSKPFFDERTTILTAEMQKLARVGFGGSSTRRRRRVLHKKTRKNNPKKRHRRTLRSGKARSHA